MPAKNKFFLILLLTLLPMAIYAQPKKIKHRDRLGDTTLLVNTAEKEPRVKGPKLFSNEISGGLKLATDGWGVFVDYGFIKRKEEVSKKISENIYSTRILQLELGEKKHNKEQSSATFINNIGFQNGSFIYGKINSFYQAKLSFGNRYMIAGKPESKTVSVHWVYAGGYAAGFVKPHIIDVPGLGQLKYSEDTHDVFLSQGVISNGGGILTGWNDMEFISGITLRSALHFDFANRRKSKIALEAGGSVDYYFNEVKLMIGQDPTKLFINAYLALQIGVKR